MNAKEYLNQAWELNQMINDKMEKAERLRWTIVNKVDRRREKNQKSSSN